MVAFGGDSTISQSGMVAETAKRFVALGIQTVFKARVHVKKHMANTHTAHLWRVVVS